MFSLRCRFWRAAGEWAVKSGKMDKVAAVAKFAEQKSAQEFSASSKSHQQKREQLDQLAQFKVDYELALDAKGSSGIDASQLQNYRQFLVQLNQAIAQQSREVENSRESLEIVKAKWFSTSQRKKALEHLVDERQKKQVKAREKAEQKQSDEDSMTRKIIADDS